MNRILELTQKLQACPGFAILAEIRSIWIARDMNNRNLLDLQDSLLAYTSLAEVEDTVFPANSSHDESEIINVMRLVHNYLASSNTLIDHTRRIVRQLCASIPFFNEYQKRVNDSFVNNPLPKFVQDLRNFTLHRSIPLRGSTVARDHDGTISGYYKLDREALSGWNKWSSLSRRFLADADGDLLVNDVFSAYHEIVLEFYSWLEHRLSEVFASEIKEEATLRQEIREQVQSVNRRTG